MSARSAAVRAPCRRDRAVRATALVPTPHLAPGAESRPGLESFVREGAALAARSWYSWKIHIRVFHGD